MKLTRIVTLLALVSQVVLFGCKKSESTPISNVPPELKATWKGTTTGASSLAILGGTALPGTCSTFDVSINFQQGPDKFTQLKLGQNPVGCSIQTLCGNPNVLGGDRYYDGAFTSRTNGNTLILEHSPSLFLAFTTCVGSAGLVTNTGFPVTSVEYKYENRAQGYQAMGLPTQTTITLTYALSNNNNTLTLTIPGTSPAISYVLQRQ